ncbi:MAG: hypothetical protein ABGZ17_12635 [Planctomycetaceae bacterium]
MTSQDDWLNDDGHNASDPMDDLIGRPQKSGMSTWLKVLLVIFGVFGLVCCGCCGGAWYWFSQQELDMDNPAGARAVAQEVLKQSVPEDMFEPKGSLDFSFFSLFEMKMGLFEAKNGDGVLMIMKMAVPQQPGQEEQFEQALRGQSAQNSKRLVIESSETKTLKLKGIGEVAFQFSKGKETSTNKDYREIQGVLPSPGGGALFLLQMEDEIYDEAAIIEWLTGEPVVENLEGQPPADQVQPPQEPDADKPDAAKTDADKTDADKPDADKPDAAKTDAAKTDAAKTDAAKTDAAKTDAAKPDAAKPDADQGEQKRDAA